MSLRLSQDDKKGWRNDGSNGSLEKLANGGPLGWHPGGPKPVKGDAPDGEWFLEAEAGAVQLPAG